MSQHRYLEITGWGAHHIDTAHWDMGMEYSGPIEVWGHASFPTDDSNYKGLWEVHGIFRTEAMYANGVHMIVSNELTNGVKFIGTEGWVWVTRGSYRVTDRYIGTLKKKRLRTTTKKQ